jgi:hypothetical protein
MSSESISFESAVLKQLSLLGEQVIELKRMVEAIKDKQDKNQICGYDRCYHPAFMHYKLAGKCFDGHCECGEFDTIKTIQSRMKSAVNEGKFDAK